MLLSTYIRHTFFQITITVFRTYSSANNQLLNHLLHPCKGVGSPTKVTIPVHCLIANFNPSLIFSALYSEELPIKPIPFIHAPINRHDHLECWKRYGSRRMRRNRWLPLHFLDSPLLPLSKLTSHALEHYPYTAYISLYCESISSDVPVVVKCIARFCVELM